MLKILPLLLFIIGAIVINVAFYLITPVIGLAVTGVLLMTLAVIIGNAFEGKA